MPANKELESIHVYNLPKGTKEKVKKVAKKHKTSANKLIAGLIKKVK